MDRDRDYELRRETTGSDPTGDRVEVEHVEPVQPDPVEVDDATRYETERTGYRTGEPVDVQTERVSVRETRYDERSDAGVAEARRRFGGFDIPAQLVGMLTALALTAILGGLVAAALGLVGANEGVAGNVEELSLAGIIGGLLTLFISFLIGGWAAARIARYDGGKNGIMTAVWAIILGLILAALGAWIADKYNVLSALRNISLPGFFNTDTARTGGIISGIGSLIAMLLGGWLGGKWGERYHRRADSALLSARQGGIVQERRSYES